MKKRGRPTKQWPGWIRVTNIMRIENKEKLVAYAYWKDIELREALDAIMKDFFERPENKCPMRVKELRDVKDKPVRGRQKAS